MTATRAVQLGLFACCIVALLLFARSERHATALEIQINQADSAAADAKRQRDAVLKSNAQLADSIAAHERRSRIADSIATLNRARVGVLQVQRDSARAALRRAESPSDSIAALVAKSTADDAVIAEQERVIAQQQRALEAERAANTLLHSAVDSATAQLHRDAAVEAQLRAALKAARPSAWQRWTDRAIGAVGGYLVGRLTP